MAGRRAQVAAIPHPRLALRSELATTSCSVDGPTRVHDVPTQELVLLLPGHAEALQQNLSSLPSARPHTSWSSNR
eukprot:7737222-Alexandrium_andersonii.AAC.1